MKKAIFALIIAVFALFIACNQTQDFALDILPQDDLIHSQYVDTFTVEATTLPYTHIQTNGYQNVLLGSYYDPIFGYTKASCVIQPQQFGYPEFNDSTSYTVDSVVLFLVLDQTYTPYGKPYNPIEFNVYTVTDTLFFYEKYYADQDLSQITNYELVGSGSFTYLEGGNDSAIIIHLDPQIGQRLVDSVDYYFYTEEGFFTDRFKGFIIEPTGYADAAIYSLKLTTTDDPRTVLENTLSYMYIYYHPDTLPDTTLVYQLPITSIMGTSFTVIEHDYSNTDVFNPAIDSVAFLQTAGTRIKLTFPYLSALENKVIHKAELYIPLADPYLTQETSYPTPDKVYMVAFENDTSTDMIMVKEFFDVDRQYYIGFDRQIDHYTINVTHLIQRMIEERQQGVDTLQYNLLDLFTEQKFTRAVITTKNNSNPLRLVVFYSDY